MVMCISYMHPTLIKAIGYVTGVIQIINAEKHMETVCNVTNGVKQGS